MARRNASPLALISSAAARAAGMVATPGCSLAWRCRSSKTSDMREHAIGECRDFWRGPRSRADHSAGSAVAHAFEIALGDLPRLGIVPAQGATDGVQQAQIQQFRGTRWQISKLQAGEEVRKFVGLWCSRHFRHGSGKYSMSSRPRLAAAETLTRGILGAPRFPGTFLW